MPQLKRETGNSPSEEEEQQEQLSMAQDTSENAVSHRSHRRKRHRELSGMDVSFFGTSGGSPTADRNPSSLAVRLSSEMVLVDAGDGTLRQIMRSEVSYAKLTRVLVTHTHADHLFGLPSTLTAILHARRGCTLHVYGPEGLFDFLAAAFSFSFTCLPGKLVVHELCGYSPSIHTNNNNNNSSSSSSSRRSTNGRSLRIGQKLRVRGKFELDPIYPDEGTGTACPGEAVPNFNDTAAWKEAQNLPVWSLFHSEVDGVLVRATPLRHTVPCFLYTFEEPARRGHLIPEKCTELGLPPGPAYKDLKAGKSVTTHSGRVISPEEVTTEPTSGRKLCVCGDTTHPNGAERMARDADVLIHEATFRRGMEKKAKRFGHSTAAMAGAFARRANAGALVLQHFGGRFAPVFSENEGYLETGESSSHGLDNENTLESLRHEAEKEFAEGAVVCASDFLTLKVPLINQQKASGAHTVSVCTTEEHTTKSVRQESPSASPTSKTDEIEAQQNVHKVRSEANPECQGEDEAVSLKRGSRRTHVRSRGKKKRAPSIDQSVEREGKSSPAFAAGPREKKQVTEHERVES